MNFRKDFFFLWRLFFFAAGEDFGLCSLGTFDIFAGEYFCFLDCCIVFPVEGDGVFTP